jgi:hypothetical protein
MRRFIFLALGLAFLVTPSRSGESVLYSITDQSLVVLATNRASRAGYPVREPRTDIFATDPETGRKRLVFSDANAALLLLPWKSGGSIVAGGKRIFGLAVDRQDYANDAHCTRAVYELSTDGSGKARKLFELENSGVFVSPSGSKIGYSADTHVVIRDTATGELLRDAEIFNRTIEAEGAGVVGWTPDDKRIFFAIRGGLDDDEVLWTTPNSPIGTYVMDLEGGAPRRLASEATLHPKIPDMKPSPDVAADLIGVLPDGQYLLHDSEYSPTGDHGAMYLYSLDLAKGAQRIFPLHVEGGPTSFHLSPSANKVVLTVQPRRGAGQSRVTSTPTLDVWVLNLESGVQMKLLSFTDTDVSGTKGPWLNLIGWLPN